MADPKHIWKAIEVIDRQLLGAVAGEERTMGEWMQQRGQLLSLLQPESLAPAQWVELEDRTWSLQTKLTHWRRLLIQDFAAVEQHARFVADQDPDTTRQLHLHA